MISHTHTLNCITNINHIFRNLSKGYVHLWVFLSAIIIFVYLYVMLKFGVNSSCDDVGGRIPGYCARFVAVSLLTWHLCLCRLLSAPHQFTHICCCRHAVCLSPQSRGRREFTRKSQGSKASSFIHLICFHYSSRADGRKSSSSILPMFNRKHFDSDFIFHKLHNQSASFVDEEVRGYKAEKRLLQAALIRRRPGSRIYYW